MNLEVKVLIDKFAQLATMARMGQICTRAELAQENEFIRSTHPPELFPIIVTESGVTIKGAIKATEATI